MHIPRKIIPMSNPVIVGMIILSKTVSCSWSGPMLGVVGTVVGVSPIWHSDWMSAGNNRSHPKSTAYRMSFKKRTGPDRYQFLRVVYNCCVRAASLVLMLPGKTVALSTSLRQNEWVMVMVEEGRLWHTVPKTETV